MPTPSPILKRSVTPQTIELKLPDIVKQKEVFITDLIEVI